MHLVLGATGGFGGAMVRALRARDLPVRAMLRDPARAKLPPGVEVVQGDASSVSAVVAAAKGCASIVHGVNLPFPEWDPTMLRITDNVVEASGLCGAPIVFPGNIFGLKPIFDAPLPPDGPTLDYNDRPVPLGRVRTLIEDQLRQHAEMTAVRVLIVRSGDFVGAGVDNALVGPMFRAALAGQPVPWFGRRDTAHVFAWVDDVAEVATRLLLREGGPTFEMQNVAGWAVTGTAWADALAKAAGTPPAGVKTTADWKVRLAGLFDKEARAFAGLLHLWEGAVLLDDSATRRALPEWTPTPMEDALAETMAWFRSHPA